MGLKSKLGFVVAVPMAVGLLASDAGAQTFYDGQLHIGGFARWSGALHYGDQNPANARVQPENNDWNRFRVWAQVNFDINPEKADWFSLFAKVNYNGDFTQDLDDNLFPHDAFPEWRNDISGQNDTNQIRLWEIYADFRPGRFWFRVGRQTLAWGDTIAFRTTDFINPLDLSWNPFGWPWFEEFQYLREPQWMLRSSYNFPVNSVPDLEIETVVNFNQLPLQFGDVGSPYNAVPAFLELVQEERDGVEAGLRFKGTFGRWALAFIYYNGYDQGGASTFRGFVPDPDRGIDFGFGGNFVLELDNLHPRKNNIGMTMNRYFQNVDGILNFEFRLTPDQPYSDINAGPPIDASTLTYSVGFDKNFQIPALNYGRSFNMGFQFQHIWLLDTDRVGDLSIGGSPVTEHSTLINYTVRTGYKNDDIQPFFLLLWDPEDGGAAWLGPYVQLIFGNHWRVWAGFNHFVASDDIQEDRGISIQQDAAKGFPVGIFHYADEFVWRVGFQF